MKSSDSNLKEKNHSLLWLWVATNGVTWVTPILTWIIFGIVDFHVVLGYDGMGLVVFIAFGIFGLFLCAIISILCLILRHYNKSAGMRFVFLVSAIIGVGFNLLFVMQAMFFRGINYILITIFLVIGFRAWSRLKHYKD